MKTDGVSPPQVGEKLPDFELKDRSGRLFRLSDFDGSYVLLNFWATWCPPCIHELPSMDQLNQRLKSHAFTMIAVSVDDSWVEVDEFMKRLSQAPSFLILHDPDKLVSTGFYALEKFPESFLVGPDRRLLKKYVGAYNWTGDEIFTELQGYMSKN